ncbi:hypothetical protein [Ascidiimonas sp. W6]|uniref:hypothetical protein n=1 Tax=Ascidiimonas meishanensis TaxID=3128903 RepID=UPI0030EDE845
MKKKKLAHLQLKKTTVSKIDLNLKGGIDSDSPTMYASCGFICLPISYGGSCGSCNRFCDTIWDCYYG